MSERDWSIAGARAVVTGASSGIGREVAIELGRAGCKVMLVGRDEERLREAAGEVASVGAPASPVIADIVTAAGREQIVSAARAELDGIDILVHSAGVYRRMAFADTTLELLDWHWDANFRAPFALTQSCLPLLAAGSSITFLSSAAGSASIPNTAAYAAAKAAVNALTGVLAVELAERGIRVNAVAPGFIATPMNEKLREDPGVAALTVSVTPLGRLGEVGDIAPAVAFLASDAARFISGAVVPVTGGYPNAFSAGRTQAQDSRS